MNISQAKQILGGDITTNSKMPGHCFGVHTDACAVGGKLHSIKGSVCAQCYARRFEQFRPAVDTGRKARLNALRLALKTSEGRRQWIDAIVTLITKRQVKWFRWHDSGDLLNGYHLAMICEVARECPDTQFWLPTREKALVSEFVRAGNHIPDNLTIRVSAAMVDGVPPAVPDGVQTSAVHTAFPIGAECKAPDNGAKCGACRMCWDKTVPTVSYKKH